MNSVYAFSRRWMGLAILTLVVAFHSGVGIGGEPRTAKSKAKRAADMVDAIVNRNKAPKIVKWQGGSTRRAALFPEDHDWKEEARVANAIGALSHDRTEEVWEELVKRGNDHRYCEVVTSVKTGDAYIEEVGSICHDLAYSRLIGVYWQHLPDSPIKEGQVVFLDLGIGNMWEWRKQLAAKSLYELQIEVCEKAIGTLAKVEGVSQDAKERARKKIEAEIENLKMRKQPADIRGGYYFEVGGVYNAELAKLIRDGVKSGKYGNLGIIK